MNAREFAVLLQQKTGCTAKWRGDKLQTRCPAHEDRNASLSLGTGKNGAVVLHCHAGCKLVDILANVNLRKADLYPEKAAKPKADKSVPLGKPVAVYPYHDESGALLYEVVRYEPKSMPKTFLQRRLNPTPPGKYLWNTEGVRRVLFRLPEVIKAIEEKKLIVLAEGEKDVLSLVKLGYAATCNCGGAGKWEEEYSTTLRHAPVVIIPDNDDPGRNHAGMVVDTLARHGCRVWKLFLPTLKNERPIKDFTDWIAAGGTPEEFAIMLDTIQAQPVAGRVEVSSVNSVDPSCVADGLGGMREWPAPPSPKAFQGLFGRIIAAVAPHTEADPVALLLHALVMFGNLVGRGPHFKVNATRHGCNLFALCIGPTGAARKGTAADMIEDLMREVDPGWVENCVKGGLVSSEGLLFHVRDPHAPTKDKGVTDKRLVAIESEFSRVLNMMQRQGNALSEELRKAFDGKRMQSLAKNCPLVASDPHISIIGHIVRDELLSCLESTETVNGFANRLIFNCVKRSQNLPFGGTVPESTRSELVACIRKAVNFARRIEAPVEFDPDARELWAKAYDRLREPGAGIIGSLLQRGDAICRRLATVYAVADQSAVVKVEHLEAALAYWDYSADSCRYIFGEATGNKVAERIKGALKESPEGLTRTEVNDLFHGNTSAEGIDNAIRLLESMGLVQVVVEPKPEGAKGRSTTRIIPKPRQTPEAGLTGKTEE